MIHNKIISEPTVLFRSDIEMPYSGRCDARERETNPGCPERPKRLLRTLFASATQATKSAGPAIFQQHCLDWCHPISVGVNRVSQNSVSRPAIGPASESPKAPDPHGQEQDSHHQARLLQRDYHGRSSKILSVKPRCYRGRVGEVVTEPLLP